MESKNNKDRKLEVQNYSSFDDLYSSITKEGSLGLLALGAKGLLIWRKKRAGIEAADKKEIKDEQ